MPGHTFGTFDLDGNTSGYYLRQKNLDLAEVKPSLQKVAHLDGMKISGEVVNERLISCVVEVIGASRSDLESKLDTLDLALRLKQQQLAIHTLDTRYFVADCIKAPVTFAGDKAISALVNCTFLCAVSYAYSSTTSTQSVAGASLTLVSGSTYKYADQTFSGGGTAVALPQIHLVSTNNVAWTQVQITESTDSRTLTITSNLPSATNDYLDIYCDPNLIPTGGYSIQKNGTTGCAFSGIFSVLQPTSTSWTIQVTTGGSMPAGSALWTWQARYLR
jgi:hypothetical protein